MALAMDTNVTKLIENKFLKESEIAFTEWKRMNVRPSENTLRKTLLIANFLKMCKCIGRETLNLQRQTLEQKSTSILRSWWVKGQLRGERGFKQEKVPVWRMDKDAYIDNVRSINFLSNLTYQTQVYLPWVNIYRCTYVSNTMRYKIKLGHD